MAIRVNFGGNCIENGKQATGRDVFGTTGLSGVSDFATHADEEPRGGTAWRKLAMIVVLVACASPASAESLVSSTSCKYSRYYGYDNCRTIWTRIPAAVRNPEQERLDALALQKEDAKWEAFCKPKFRADEFGVRRATYATQGCEFGRSE